ncbi:serine-rich adhesin for platelets [Drosophila obscura]|uniref:serine-rich adhesin for platelets n=1 Tax=Drosophila obscura TaxID=7282 RepID=UPI001BB27CE8|nr:serine-rich adhesin for platelets [Drosophila obscura]
MGNMADIDYEPFNPFNVGPPNSGKRMEFKIPTSPTYPPPVFAVIQQDKQGYIKRSVSQESGSAPAVQKAETASHLKIGQSKTGEVAVSKAINEEMATAKQQAAALDEEGRFDAGGISKMRLPSSKSSIDSKSRVQSKVSVRTLLPVKSRRQASGDGQAEKRSTSESSVSTKASKVSRGSTRTRVSTSSSTKSRSSSAAKRSKKSQSSIISKRSQSSTRSKSSTASSKASLGKSLGRASNKLNPQSTTASTITLTSEVLKRDSKIKSVKASSSKEESKVSLKSKTGKKSSDTRASKTIGKPTSETISQHSVQSKTKVSTRSAFKTKKDDSTAALKSRAASSKSSLKAKTKSVNKMKTVKALADGTSLIHQAAEISERLKAGNEDNFRRFSSVIHNHSRTVPEKLFREDRMSFWFQDAVLS